MGGGGGGEIVGRGRGLKVLTFRPLTRSHKSAL